MVDIVDVVLMIIAATSVGFLAGDGLASTPADGDDLPSVDRGELSWPKAK